jgi:O-antigen/teichoic acid export membrane protein
MHDEVRYHKLVRRVAHGSVFAFAIYIAGAGLTYCSQILIARIVGVQSFGIYAYVFAWMTVLAYFSALGFDVALLRFVPAYQGQQAWALLRGVIRYAERRAALVGICILLIGIAVIPILRGSSSPELTNTFLVGFVLVPVLALLWIRCSATRALGGIVSALAPDRMVRDGILLGIVGLASLGRRWNIDATFIMVATLISSAIALGLAGLAMRRLQPRAADNIVPTYAAVRTWRRTALPLLIIGGTEILLNRAGVIMLGWFGETKEAGIYALAFNIAFLTVLPRTAVNVVFAPTISDLFARQDRAMLQVLVARAASWMLCGAACIALALWFLAEPALAWSGKDFGIGVPVLRILLIGQVFAAGAGSQLYLMTMSGHERSAAVLLVLSVTVYALVGAVLISLFGLVGAAIAYTAALIAWNVAMAFFVWRRLRLLPGPLATSARYVSS